jgi:GNAT superfamily N-acetyltransferase
MDKPANDVIRRLPAGFSAQYPYECLRLAGLKGGNPLILRKATIHDIDLLIRLRMDYFKAESYLLQEYQEGLLKEQLFDYFSRHLAQKTFLAMIAEQDGAAVATAFLTITEQPASPCVPTGKIGTLYNVLTYPDYRRQGIATKLILALIEETKRRQVSALKLSATRDGHPLYEKLGFYTAGRYTHMEMQLN